MPEKQFLKHQQGAVLMIVLIFCLLVAGIANIMMETSILQLKMIQNYKENSRLMSEVEGKLEKMESRLEQEVEPTSIDVSFIQFVPDTLVYQEPQGVNYYRLFAQQNNPLGDVLQLTTTFCTRKIVKQNQISKDEAAISNLTHIINPNRIWHFLPITIANGEIVWIVIYTPFSNKGTRLAIINLMQNKVIKEFTIEGKLTSQVLVTDIFTRGRADYIYFGTNLGDIVKINISETDSILWSLASYKDLIKGYMVGSLIAGRHPEGKGCLLYALVENEGRTFLQVLETNANELRQYYQLEQFSAIGQPLLWHGFLLTSIADNQLAVFDAFAGKLIQLIPLITTKYFDVAQEMYLPPQVIIKQPVDKNPIVMVRSSFAAKQCEAPLLAARLGRKTWQRL